MRLRPAASGIAISLLLPGLAAAADAEAWQVQRSLVQSAKPALALGAVVLLGWGILLRRRGRGGGRRSGRDLLWLLLSVASGLAAWNFLQFHYSHYVHWHDTYHYYMGSKYFPELGYTRLYVCTAVADREDGVGPPLAQRTIRDLMNNTNAPAVSIIHSPADCTRHFSPERWRDFRLDVARFRAELHPQVWLLLQTDHGYNATPIWTALGGTLANALPAGNRFVFAIALLDPLLLLSMWGCCLWAFGWRATGVALVFWGTNALGDFSWTGGAYLRQGWLAATVISICMLRSGRPAAAGFSLALASLLRIFPALVVCGLLAKIAADSRRERRFHITREQRRFAFGGLAGLALLLSLATATGGSLDSWSEFQRNTQLHADTPLLNDVGLPAVVSYDHAHRAAVLHIPGATSDPYESWKRWQRRTTEERRGLLVLCVIAYLVLLGAAARGQPDWVALALGAGLVPMALELSGYYVSLLLVLGFLAPRRPGVGVALCLLAAASFAPPMLLDHADEVYVATSVLIVATVLYATSRFAWRADTEEVRLP